MLISGGQTGVDRSALDFALEMNINCGGWCPKNRRAEDGVIPDIYPLCEAGSELYQQRTRLNVRDSDATMVFLDKTRRSRGTALTVKTALQMFRPCLVIDTAGYDLTEISDWLWKHRPAVLNIAGPRLSESREAASKTYLLLKRLIKKSENQQIVWPPLRPFTRRLL